METVKYDAFVSFSFKDYDLAYGIVQELQTRHGLNCWICTQELRAGTSYKAEIVKAINASNALVLIGTCHSLASEQVASEIGYTRNQRKKIIPFMCDTTEPTGEIAYDLGALHRIAAFVPPMSDRIDELAAVLKSIRAQSAPSVGETPEPIAKPAPEPKPAPVKEKPVKSKPVKQKSKKSKRSPLAVIGASVLAFVVLVFGAIVLGDFIDSTKKPDDSKSTLGQQEETDPTALAYSQAKDDYNNGNFGAAAVAFGKLGDYRDSAYFCQESWKQYEWIHHSTFVAADVSGMTWIESDHGLSVTYTPYDEMKTGWIIMDSIVLGNSFAAGLSTLGDIMIAGEFPGTLPDEAIWSDLVSISAAGGTLVGLKKDGTVVAAGDNENGQCNVEDWSDIVSIRTCAEGYTLGVRADGTVVYAGNVKAWTPEDEDSFPSEFGIIDLVSKTHVSEWKDMAYICTTPYFVVDRDHKAHYLINENYLSDDLVRVLNAIESLTNVKDIVLGNDSFLILRTDGTLTVIDGEGAVHEQVNKSEGFNDIVAVTAGIFGEAVLRSDGTVLLTEGSVLLYAPKSDNVLVPDQPTKQ
jgi:hypothetical protein